MNREFSFVTNLPEFYADLLEVAHLFFVGAPVEGGEIKIVHTVSGKHEIVSDISVNEKNYRYLDNLPVSENDKLLYKRYYKRFIKLALYKAFCDYTGVISPWGSLTGIRPTKLWYDLVNEGNGGASRVFQDIFLVSPEKTMLTESIIDAQKTILSRDENAVDLYIGIPFCTSRCNYCSFSSGLISNYYNQLDEYVSRLIDEITASRELIEGRFKKLRAIYVGGGTPSSLPPDMLGRVLDALPADAAELTVEAGRPDGITPKLLDILAARGVTRVSINPQTLNDKTLLKVGRRHTAEEFFQKFALAKKYGFAINSDLIAALPGESAEDFKNSIDGLISLAPENITVHTLALKRGAELAENPREAEVTDAATVKEMVDYSQSALVGAGYVPYYMYRQKYMAGNFENVGFSKQGFACLYNVDMMEETTSIIACGAGAISKRVFGGDALRIVRAPNVKDIKTYLARTGEMIERKRKLFDTKLS